MKKIIIILTLAAFILGFFAAQVFSPIFQAPPGGSAPNGSPGSKMELPAQSPSSQDGAFTPASIESSATINLVAVDSSGKGVAMPLTVQKRAGYGETLININNLVFWFDTQQSIQTARNVAYKIAGFDMDRINLVYIIDANATVVEGPSAGAALAIATIAALKDKPLKPDVMITGTVNPDGTIGQVGGILEKASAAKEIGAKLFLVPGGQGTETLLQPVESCSTRDFFTYCTTKYVQTEIDISEKAGLPVKEVSTIEEAEKYFFG